MTRTVAAAVAALPSDRRSFLRQLTALPLIGGGVSLIGQPTAVAEPVTSDLLEAYKTWLDFERRELSWQIAGDYVVFADRYRGVEGGRVARFEKVDRTFSFIGDSGSYHFGDNPSPYTRAALVLSAVGCDWRNGVKHNLARGAGA